MARLSELTDRSAVGSAVAEFVRIGRNNFLEKYGFAESRAYFAKVGDELIDSNRSSPLSGRINTMSVPRWQRRISRMVLPPLARH